MIDSFYGGVYTIWSRVKHSKKALHLNILFYFKIVNNWTTANVTLEKVKGLKQFQLFCESRKVLISIFFFGELSLNLFNSDRLLLRIFWLFYQNCLNEWIIIFPILKCVTFLLETCISDSECLSLEFNQNCE